MSSAQTRPLITHGGFLSNTNNKIEYAKLVLGFIFLRFPVVVKLFHQFCSIVLSRLGAVAILKTL